jgi:hypothetical protein
MYFNLQICHLLRTKWLNKTLLRHHYIRASITKQTPVYYPAYIIRKVIARTAIKIRSKLYTGRLLVKLPQVVTGYFQNSIYFLSARNCIPIRIYCNILYSWDRASLDIEVVYMTNKMRQIHSIYYDQQDATNSQYLL